MPLAAQILAVLAALIHVFFFYLESIVWSKPSTWKTFGLKTQEEAEITKGLALNQGFYNLFLAIGVIVGVVGDATAKSVSCWTTYAPLSDKAANNDLNPCDLSLWDRYGWGGSVVTFGLACMVGAALVLLVSSKGKMARGAAIQGVLPLAALLIIAIA